MLVWHSNQCSFLLSKTVWASTLFLLSVHYNFSFCHYAWQIPTWLQMQDFLGLTKNMDLYRVVTWWWWCVAEAKKNLTLGSAVSKPLQSLADWTNWEFAAFPGVERPAVRGGGHPISVSSPFILRFRVRNRLSCTQSSTENCISLQLLPKSTSITMTIAGCISCKQISNAHILL